MANFNIFGAKPSSNLEELYGMGLLGRQEEGSTFEDFTRKANRQSNVQGLLTGVLSYLAQPKNQNFGSALPYLARAGLQGVSAAGSSMNRYEQDAMKALQLKEQARSVNQREKRKIGVENFIKKYPNMAYINELGDDVQDKIIAKTAEQEMTPDKPLSIGDQMDKIIFDINAKKERNEPLTLTDKANLKAATQVKLMSSSDPSGFQSAMLPGAEKGAEGQAKDFGKIANDWTIGNKAADAQKLILDLEDVAKSLSTSDDITGGFVGALPPFMKERLYPQAVATQERLEGVVQRGLRETLGAQFAKEEGELLIKRAYNPSLPEEENLKRVNRLLATMKIAVQRKNEAVEYYYKNGNTLSGFNYKPITIDDFLAVVPETSVDTVTDKSMEELMKEFPKPASMDDKTYQSILNNL